MKKLLFMLLLFPSLCFAQPYVVCDYYAASEGVDQFIVTLDGSVFPIAADVNTADASTRLKLNISTVSAGKHTLTAKARNSVWDLTSASSDPFVFDKPTGTTFPKPSNFRIIP